ncbi:NifB/NifX family molybdenum-iron cluster-binding protein [Tepidibacillus marianensis]|uniref:NifB/NifX family molybdenum-iron cluster-binding protein n=1 Tax=Tepidibacillus marianensis TaxID=3131995 RepID=UPI0030D0AFC6
MEKRKDLTSPASVIRIAVTSRGNGKVNLQFEKVTEFMIYEVIADEIRFVGIRKLQSYCEGTESCDKNGKNQNIQEVTDTIQDCQLLLCSSINDRPKEALLEKGIIPFVQYGDIDDVIHNSTKYYKQFSQKTETNSMSNLILC